MLSSAAAPVPVRMRAPRNEMYDGANADPIVDPRFNKAHMMRVIRRPNISEHGMIIKLQ
jgi:hypothetical protein